MIEVLNTKPLETTEDNSASANIFQEYLDKKVVPQLEALEKNIAERKARLEKLKDQLYDENKMLHASQAMLRRLEKLMGTAEDKKKNVSLTNISSELDRLKFEISYVQGKLQLAGVVLPKEPKPKKVKKVKKVKEVKTKTTSLADLLNSSYQKPCE